MSAPSPCVPSSSVLREAALRIIRRLQDAGYETYLAGGCVRDVLLGREPKDFDIATSARPRDVRLSSAIPGWSGHTSASSWSTNRKPISKSPPSAPTGSILDGRRPKDVRFSSAEEDAQRRDFTINGLFQNPVTGEVIDYVGGQADLQAGLIRAIGVPSDRFREDHLRLLRAVRFATDLGFELEPATLAAVKEEAPSIRLISAERVRDELVRILENPRRLRGFDLLVGTGLLSEILPEVIDLCWCGPSHGDQSAGDVFARCRRMLELLPERAALPLVLSVLLKDVAKPVTATRGLDGEIQFPDSAKASAEMTGEILRRLKFSNDVIDATVEAVLHHPGFHEVRGMRVASLKRFMARPRFDDELELHRVDCLTSDGDLTNYDYLLNSRARFGEGPLVPPRLVTGKELLARGWNSGPHLRDVLDAVQDEQLEGRVATTEQGMAWVESHFTPV